MLLVLRLVPHLPRMLQTHLHLPSVRVAVEAMVVVVVVVVQSANGQTLLPQVHHPQRIRSRPILCLHHTPALPPRQLRSFLSLYLLSRMLPWCHR